MTETKSDGSGGIARFLAGPRGIINIGLESFVDALMPLGVPVVHVQWQPPAGGDQDLLRMLAALEDGGAQRGGQGKHERMDAGEP